MLVELEEEEEMRLSSELSGHVWLLWHVLKYGV